MKMYIALFIVVCTIASLTKAELTFVHDWTNGGTTTINTIDGSTSIITYPDGTIVSAITVP